MLPSAAQFIVEKIAEQAARENVLLSSVEHKMLFFSESSRTLPDIGQANEIFDRDYDRIEYEAKITGLIRHIRSRLRADADANRAWNKAVGDLRGEDYYFMVMLKEAGVRERPPGDWLRLIVTAIVIVTVILIVSLAFAR